MPPVSPSSIALARVLFVDDDREVRDALARSLRRQGLIVDLAADGAEALTLASEYPYAVIATDQRMPGISGIDLVQRIRAIQPDATFLMVTGAFEEVASVTRMPFVSAVLPKPWNDDKLVSLVKQGIAAAKHRSEGRQMQTVPQLPAAGKFALLIDGNDSDSAELQSAIEGAHPDRFRVLRAPSLNEAIRMLRIRSYDVIFVDLAVPDVGGLHALSELMLQAPSTPVLVVTSADDERLATDLVRAGAQDYLVKGRFDAEIIGRSTQHAIERKRIETRYAELAHFDGLTGLANRTLLAERVNAALVRADRHSKRVGLLWIDLDDFKDVNDSYGHAVGDALLIEVARRLCSSSRTDDTVARVGGDEFIVLLNGLDDASGARRVAQRISNAFATPLSVDGKVLGVTPSVGIAFYPDDARSGEELMRRADAALYQAKQAGKNAYHFFSRELHDREVKRQSFERELRQAVSRGDFRLAYQPCFDAQEGLCGYETFLRWTRSDGSLLPARDFLGALGEIGELPRVGAWVVNEVCARASSWPVGTDRKRISFNVSAREVGAGGFVEMVQSTLRAHGVHGEQLEMEISEAALGRAAPELRDTLKRVAELGIGITVDGYGSGGASLFDLAALPISTLKLDPAVASQLTDERRFAAFAAVYSAANALGWRVVATGIETKEQLDIVQRAGWRRVQGTLLGAPHLS
ncbi:MAG: EAL domain-containing protein [Polyangiaceae bacterium]